MSSTGPDEQPKTCSACGKTKHPNKELLKCGQCRQAFYHDKMCQKQHWPKHKSNCRRLVQLHQEQTMQQKHVKVIWDRPDHDGDELHHGDTNQSSSSSSKGRVVVALQDFEPGDCIIVESPAIVFDTQLEYRGLLHAFGNATKEIQDKVLHLHAPPLADIDSVARQQRHARLEQQRQAYLEKHPDQATVLTTATTQRLLAIVETNAHQLFNATNVVLDNDQQQPTKSTANTTAADPSKQFMGLFLLGSMMEHSCNPNMTMNTTRDGKLELIAENFIKHGDRLSFSYIEGVFEKNRANRQEQLLREKHFTCQCSRCNDVDDCRPILLLSNNDNTTLEPCELCQTPHALFWHAGQQAYVCINTPSPDNTLPMDPQNDARLKQFLNTEQQLTMELQALAQMLQHLIEPSALQIRPVLVQLAALLTSSKWKTYVHPLHWLNVSAHQFLSTTAAAMARMQLQQSAGANQEASSSLLRLSVLALLHNMTWAEYMIHILRHDANNANTKSTDGQHATTVSSSVLQTMIASMNGGCNITLMFVKQALEVTLSNQNETFAVRQLDLDAVIKTLCEDINFVECQTTTADILLTAFYAGQDLILAGHIHMCLVLYERYQEWFHKLKQPNDDNRERIDAFLSSQGSLNPFGDNIMAL